MPLNDLAREKLRQLKRGETLPYGTVDLMRCPDCGFGVTRSRYRKTCPRPGCEGRMPPKPPVLCRLCDEPIPKGRYCWCGDECVDAYYLVTSSSHVRSRVFQRDHGVCADCGLDCHAIETRLRAMQPASRQEAKRVLGENGFNLGYYSVGTLWEADHFQARDEGGSWELSNVQTLCQPCHKEKTAEQAARRGKQQRLLGKKWRPTEKMLRLAQGSMTRRVVEEE